jgi:hypothetical protein
MPVLLLVLLIALVLLPFALLVLMPLTLFQRYRMGAARRKARPWLSTLGLVLMSLSAVGFLAGAAVTAIFVPYAFAGAAAGIAVGTGLGVAGLLLTRWEATPATLHYTPNRWLVLLVTLMVAARVLYGLWRSWQAARAGVHGTEMVLAFGIPQSLAVGGTVIGYYIAYAAGVRGRMREWERRALRAM